jgi:hypothetical protein
MSSGVDMSEAAGARLAHVADEQRRKLPRRRHECRIVVRDGCRNDVGVGRDQRPRTPAAPAGAAHVAFTGPVDGAIGQAATIAGVVGCRRRTRGRAYVRIRTRRFR